MMTSDCFSLTNPNPNPNLVGISLKNKLSSSSMASFSFAPPTSSFSLRFESIHRRQRALLIAGMAASSSPKGLTGFCLPSRYRQKKNLSVVFAASHEESNPKGWLQPRGDRFLSPIIGAYNLHEPLIKSFCYQTWQCLLRTEKEKVDEANEQLIGAEMAEIETEKDDINKGGKASQEAWDQALASFKEQALKLQSVSQEAYEVYMKKAVVTLKDTANKLKIQADQARQDLSVMTIELSEEGREYLATAAENSPEPVKDVVETFASAHDLDDVSKVRDFYIGIPYGTILSAGGFLNFMITGSLSSIRFGVILGGILLALSVSSLRSWRKGEFSDTTLKGQAAITTILFLRDARLVFEGLTFFGLLKTIISGAVAAFFIYRITYDKRQPNVDGEATS